MGPRGLVQRVDQGWHRSGEGDALPRGCGLLVAVSGGADSVALLRLMHGVNGGKYWNWRLVVGHVSHGIRGRAGAADARFVRRLAGELGLRFVERKLRLGKGASEAAAREGRLRALAAMMKAARCAGVVMAHHADDQAETVVMRMLRGCGVEGLGAMAPVTAVGELPIYRPLLGVRRGELRAYLREIRQGWREDESNATGRYVRNRVRAEVLPAMEGVAPGCVEALGRLAAVSRETWGLVERARQVAWRICVVREGRRRVELDREGLERVPAVICAEMLRRAVERVGGSREIAGYERVMEGVRAVRGQAGGQRIEVGGGVTIAIAREQVVVSRRERRKKDHGE